jgi:Uma2 family endonuclease
MALPQPKPKPQRWTPGEYLAFERAAETRHEFFDGEIFAMAGASFEHNQIAGNLAFALRSQLRDRPCDVLSSDMRVKVEATGLFTDPDVVMVCGEPRFGDDALDTLLNPVLLVEVLSPSAEAYDRGRKFAHYRAIPSLTDYVLVAQDRRAVEHFARSDDGAWVLRAADENNGGSTLRIESLGCDIALDNAYRRVAFPEPETAAQES